MKVQIDILRNHIDLYKALLKESSSDLIYWRQQPDKWCLLEIVCHLYDEEREDFRFRTKWILERPGELPPMFNPIDWVTQNRYIEQDYQIMFSNFIEERKASILWLDSLNDPNWEAFYTHPKLGDLTARHYLNNWVAHDYLHIRQITKLKFDYLKDQTGANLDYAGKW